MSKPRRKHSTSIPSWSSLREEGLSERHVLMALDLGYRPGTLNEAYFSTRPNAQLLLLEWIEDAYFAQFGRYVPMDETATPESQSEHPAENSLLPDSDKIMDDFLRDSAIIPGSDDEGDRYEELGQRIIDAESKTPASYGEIYQEDQRMLQQQENFRKAARVLTQKLADLPEVEKVLLFGSVALPLWKEVPRFSRLSQKNIKIFHECANIDLAVWVKTPNVAPTIRRAHAATVNDLLAQHIHFSIAHHHFSTHLIDQASGQVHGMVCHYNQCPKHKPACQVSGCGASKFVRVLPGFKLKPERLNTHNSQVLFER